MKAEPQADDVGGGVETVAAATASVKAEVAACGELSESFTVRLKEAVPLAVGVPLMVPEVPSVKPAGKLPEMRVQV